MIISKNLCIQNIGIILLWGDDLFLQNKYNKIDNRKKGEFIIYGKNI